jgi:hypothetical protein
MYFPKQKRLYWGKRGGSSFNSSLWFSRVLILSFNLFLKTSYFYTMPTGYEFGGKKKNCSGEMRQTNKQK